MSLTFSQMLQASHDTWCRSRYERKRYRIQGGKKHPFAVICPGGGYSMVCSFLEGVPYAKRLNEMGYSAFVLYYRVRGQAKYPAPQEDLACAVREILANAERWNLETENYSVWGSSAGGHLAASFGTETMGYAHYGLPEPGALILCYPVITMGSLTHPGSRENLLGKHASDESAALCSVENQITENYPRTYVWCGDADRLVPPENSRMLSQALKAKGGAHLLREYPGVDHGVGMGKGLACEGWFEEAVGFWRKESGNETA